MWDVLFKKTIEKGNVKLIKNHCLRQRCKHNDCDCCIAQCPQQALFINEQDIVINTERCTGCGLCTHICPTGALTIPKESLTEYEKKIHDRTGVCICCDLVGDKETDVIVPCIHGLSLELFLIPLLKGIPVQIYWNRQKCQSCKKGPLNPSMDKGVALWNQCFGQTYPIQIVYEAKQKNGRAKGLTRRELFAFSKNNVKKTIGSFLFESFEERSLRDKIPMNEKRLYLKLFLKNMFASSQELLKEWLDLFSVGTQQVSEACPACGRCSLICPTGALTHSKEPYLSVLRHEAIKCIHCGICGNICSNITIEIDKAKSVEEILAPVVLKKSNMKKCTECGIDIPETWDFCEDCDSANRRQNLFPW